jgi:hypothetical protein
VPPVTAVCVAAPFIGSGIDHDTVLAEIRVQDSNDHDLTRAGAIDLMGARAISG